MIILSSHTTEISVVAARALAYALNDLPEMTVQEMTNLDDGSLLRLAKASSLIRQSAQDEYEARAAARKLKKP